MKPGISSVLPRRAIEARKASVPTTSSRQLTEAAASDPEALLQGLGCSRNGLSDEEAERRLKQYGLNAVASEQRHGRLRLLGKALLNPLVILLSVLATVSIATGDIRAAAVMGLMVVLGVVLRFVQEARADTAAAKLRAMIRVTATVVREGKPREVPLVELVPGDVVKLCAGDMIPADVRLIGCKDLFVTQASLTRESLPIEKFDAKEKADARSPLELRNLCFLGTSVESGTATAVAVATGDRTLLGTIARGLVGRSPRPRSTEADRREGGSRSRDRAARSSSDRGSVVIEGNARSPPMVTQRRSALNDTPVFGLGRPP